MSASHSLMPDGKSTVFSFYDLDEEKIWEIPLPLEFPHTAIGHPVKRNLVIVPESGGERACVVDILGRRVIKELRAPAGRLWGGHGTFTPDGSRFYSSEFEALPSGLGFVSEWKADDFSHIRSFPSFGRFPHDVVLARDGLSLTASNLGAETGAKVKGSGIHVSRLKVATGALLDRVELDDSDQVDASHAQEGTFITRDDPIMRTDARYFMSYMRVAVPDFKIFVYAHSHRKLVTVWNIEERRLLHEIQFDEQPRALVLLPQRTHFAVVMESGKIVFIDAKRYEQDRTFLAKQKLRVTTHVNTWRDYGGAAGFGQVSADRSYF